MVLMTCLYVAVRRSRGQDRGALTESRTPLLSSPGEEDANEAETSRHQSSTFDIVPLSAIDLIRDEHQEDEEDLEDEDERTKNLAGKWGFAWRIWYQFA